MSLEADSIANKVSEEAYALFSDGQLEKSLQYYTLLKDSSSTPYSLSQNAAKNAKLVAEKIQFQNQIGVAQWFYSEGDFLNAALVASKKIAEGYNSNSAIYFMYDASEKLSEKAYASFVNGDYGYALKCYSALSYLNHVPDNLKNNAITNVKVVESYLKK